MRTRPIDFDATRKHLAGRCFICELLAGNPDFRHQMVYEDESSVAFLNRYPALYGHVLVTPKAHREQVTGDFSREESSPCRKSCTGSARRFAVRCRRSGSACSA